MVETSKKSRLMCRNFQKKVDIPIKQAVKALSLVIISRIKEWSQRIMEAIHRVKDPYLLCPRFKEGFKCDLKGCEYKHKFTTTLQEDTNVLECLTMAVRLDSTLHSATELFEQLSIVSTTASLVEEKQKWLSSHELIKFLTSTRLMASEHFQHIMAKDWALETAVKEQLE
uniref:C3H1-type domain-containing protein n=1 Tax=Biomphalaria glabrata TaxID=6526 RepID=A0A2C9LWV4_BIOGL